MNLLIKELSKISKSFYAKNKLVEDIILFGSLMRGKDKPSDIDVLMLFKNKVDKNVEYEFRKKASHIANLQLTSKTQEALKSSSFLARDGVLFEGYSLVHQKFLASEYGFSSFGIFLYETKKFSNTKRTRFYYALNGRRGSQGFIHSTKSIKLSNNVLLSPLDKIEEVKEFFKQWDVEYMYVHSLIPSRLARENILKKLSLRTGHS